jgi:DUF971 family protein
MAQSRARTLTDGWNRQKHAAAHGNQAASEIAHTRNHVRRRQDIQPPCELLRVYSPSAEVRGHGPGQEVLQTGKKDVAISKIEPVGTYAVQLCFADGHDTGIFSWDLLYDYGMRQNDMWQHYLRRLAESGASRDNK